MANPSNLQVRVRVLGVFPATVIFEVVIYPFFILFERQKDIQRTLPSASSLALNAHQS